MAILPTLALSSPTNNRCQHPSPSPTQPWDMERVEVVDNRWELGEWQTSTREHSIVLVSSLERSEDSGALTAIQKVTSPSHLHAH